MDDTNRDNVIDLMNDVTKWREMAEKLAGYAEHTLCDISDYYPDSKCTCGLSELLAEFEEMKG